SDVVIDNSACVNSTNANTECVTSDLIKTLDVKALPATGETPWWRDWLIVVGIFMSLVMAMSVIRLKQHAV
ncbi:MAG TPA: hypothetical protein PLZ51_27025, partial [Aggregatilineales bacterium]|nr:hypothetical protein [Aggregatilineales bacterium]